MDMRGRRCGVFSLRPLILFILGATFFLVPVANGPTSPLDESSTPPAGILRSFVARGHVLGFGTGKLWVSSSSHMLSIELAGSNGVAPVIVSPPIGSDPASASPFSPSDYTASPAPSSASAPRSPSPNLTRVTYPDAWDGVTVAYERSKHGILQSSYLIASGSPDSAVASIRLRYNRPVRIAPDGRLSISFPHGEMRESAPLAWQESRGSRIPVAVSYRPISDHEIGFLIGNCDPSLPLTIDPILDWHTFLGGIGSDNGYGIAVDGSGNVYVAGDSNTTWGSVTRAYTSGIDGYAAKLDSDGNLLWNAFLGGSGNDYVYGIAVDGSGNVYAGGDSNATWGSNPKIGYSSGYDGFVAKLDSSGSLVWHTFLGGSGTEVIKGAAIDGSGNVVVAGYSNATWGSPVQAFVSGVDAFAAKLDSSGNLAWSTFLGGSGNEFGECVAADSSGNVYVGGDGNGTWGTAVQRAYTAGSDGFAAKLDSAGAYVWNAFQGGGGSDYSFGIAVDGSNQVYVGGYSTADWGAPTPIRSYSASADAFAAKLSSSGGLTWHTFLGSSNYEAGRGIAVDAGGNVYVGGNGFGTWTETPLRAYTSGADAFAAKLSSAGSLTWYIFLGDSGGDYGYGIAFDGSAVYVGGLSSATWGTSPVTAFAGGLQDAFAAKMPETPTSVGLVSFMGEAADGGIELTWLTASEPDNAGFHLWRAAGENAPYERITPALIPARGDAVSGAAYAYLDSDVVQGQTYLYRLEDVDTAGRSEFHGPVTVVMGRIELLGPENGLQATIHAPVRFAWDGGPFVQFRVEFSADADFAQTGLSLPADWQRESFLEPSKTDWNRIRAAANESGILYWRVRGKTHPGAESTSASRWLRVR